MFYIMEDTLPSWTDVAQVIIGTIGMVVALWTLRKLVSRDLQREAEIYSLTMIARQLRDLQSLNEKRHLESKKPKMKIELKRDLQYFINFTNLNGNCQITEYNKKEIGRPLSGSISSISNSGNVQHFNFSVPNLITNDLPRIFELTYIVESTYIYKQIVKIHLHGINMFTVKEVQ